MHHQENQLNLLCGILLDKKNTTDCDLFHIQRLIFCLFVSPSIVPIRLKMLWTRYILPVIDQSVYADLT